jgi:hypothetical protein
MAEAMGMGTLKVRFDTDNQQEGTVTILLFFLVKVLARLDVGRSHRTKRNG